LGKIITLILGGENRMKLNLVEVKCHMGREPNVYVSVINMNIAIVYESITELSYRPLRLLAFKKLKRKKLESKIKYKMC
jgi:hypothetical protein